MQKCCYGIDANGKTIGPTCSPMPAPTPTPAPKPALPPTPAPIPVTPTLPLSTMGCCWRYNCASDSNTVSDPLTLGQCPPGIGRTWVPGPCAATKPASACGSSPSGSVTPPPATPPGSPPATPPVTPSSGLPVMEPTYTGPIKQLTTGSFPPMARTQLQSMPVYSNMLLIPYEVPGGYSLVTSNLQGYGFSLPENSMTYVTRLGYVQATTAAKRAAEVKLYSASAGQTTWQLLASVTVQPQDSVPVGEFVYGKLGTPILLVPGFRFLILMDCSAAPARKYAPVASVALKMMAPLVPLAGLMDVVVKPGDPLPSPLGTTGTATKVLLAGPVVGMTPPELWTPDPAAPASNPKYLPVMTFDDYSKLHMEPWVPAVRVDPADPTKTIAVPDLTPPNCGAANRAVYPYASLCMAVQSFPEAFKGLTEPAAISRVHNAKREIAALLANMAQEIGGCWGTDLDTQCCFNSKVEMGSQKPPNPSLPSCYTNSCAAGYTGLYYCNLEADPGLGTCSEVVAECKKYGVDALKDPELRYFGRGAIQLTGTSNYANTSRTLFGDPYPLVCHPEYVVTKLLDGWLPNLEFWMMQTSGQDATCHEVMVSPGWTAAAKSKGKSHPGFAGTISIINSECPCCDKGTPSNECNNPYRRQWAYGTICAKWGIPYEGGSPKVAKAQDIVWGWGTCVDYNPKISCGECSPACSSSGGSGSGSGSGGSATAQCGPDKPCPNGLCCSKYGFCGSTPEYCGTTKPATLAATNDPDELLAELDLMYRRAVTQKSLRIATLVLVVLILLACIAGVVMYVKL